MLVIICLMVLAILFSGYILKTAGWLVAIAIELIKIPWQLAVDLAKMPLAESLHIIFAIACFVFFVRLFI